MSDHGWCRDVSRDEAVRAAEDAAAVPSIQHRDLPEQVALLWASLGDIIGRVVRLEGEMDAGQDEEAAPAEGMRKERGESVRVVDEADAASDEAVAHGATLNALGEARESLAAANRGIARLTAERDAAIRERDALKGSVEALEANRESVSGSIAESLENKGGTMPADGLRTERVTLEVTHRKHTAHEWAWPQMIWLDEIRGESVRVVEETKRGRLPDMVARLTAERDAAIRERDAARRAVAVKHDHALQFRSERDAALVRVAELEAAAAPATNAGVEKQEPVAWGVLMTPGSKVWRCSSEKQAQKCVDHFGTGTVVPLYAAPPPRGWLTEEERALIEYLRATFEQNADAWRPHGLGGHVDNQDRRVRLLDAILARSTPPRVKVPSQPAEFTLRAWNLCVSRWIAAIRAAGGEVEG